MEPRPSYPRGNLFIKYNLPARLYFCWLDPLFCYGVKHTLQHKDLYAHPPPADSEYLLNRFNKYWSTELTHYKNGGTPRLWRALAKAFWKRILAQGILSFTLAMFLLMQSLILGQVTEYFTLTSPTPTQTRNVYLLATAMAVLLVVNLTNNGGCHYIGYKLGMLIRIACTTAIYQKLLRLSQSTVGSLTSGRIVNLASNDVHRFDQSTLFYHHLWVGPIHLTLVTYFIYMEIGPTSIVAMFLVILQVPLQVFLAKSFIKLRLNAAQRTDERVKVMNEIIVGMRVIKMYGWEHAFQRLIAYLRKKEVNVILKGSLFRVINLSFYNFALPVIMFVVFSIYATLEGYCALSPKKVFTTLSLLTTVRLTSVNFLQKGILQVAEAKVALERITHLLLQDELVIEKSSNAKLPSTHFESSSKGVELLSFEGANGSLDNGPPCLTVTDLSASWSNDPDKLCLKNVSFSLNKSSPLLGVVGTVGSGKSTLLQCLLDELPITNGVITKRGSVGYSAQEPWIYSSTLRENILFGRPFEPDWYEKVIDVCCLENDIQLLQHGDHTLVGERGVTLSGGQKARVSLARAVYSKADIYLLDDPLSAVDAAVGRHIFEKCVRGLLSESSLVVLVTHQLQYIHQCDTVLGLKEGDVMFSGVPSDITSRGIDFLSLIGDNLEEEKRQKEEEMKSMFAVRRHSAIKGEDVVAVVSEVPSTDEREEEDRSVSDLGDNISADSVEALVTKDEEIDPASTNKKDSKELSSEEKAQGSVGIKTYYQYFLSGGGRMITLIVLLLFLVAEGSIVGTDTVISLWTGCYCSATDCMDCNYTDSSICNLGLNGLVEVYAGTVASTIVLCFLRVVLFYILCLRAATVLHNKMFNAVIRAPVLFFDTNSVGRILNRFSKDMGFLDDILIYSFCEFLMLFCRFLAIMSTAVASNPYLLIMVVIVSIVFGFMRWYYLQTGREVKRIEAIARSPLYSHVSMTIQGLPTIRAYGNQTKLTNQFHTHQNSHTQAWDAYIVTARWFGQRLDFLSSMFVTLVFFSSISLADVLNLNHALVGLALTYALSLSGMFQYCIRLSTEVENYMISAERVIAYTHLESEAPLETTPAGNKPSPEWPDKGRLEIEELKYRHSPEGPFVLRGLTFTIESGEKVGVVGRTGAGKSSLIASFFRLAEPQGSIVIDGMDCLSLGLHDVRKKIAIIPQDPVLFSGTVRYNLDPFDSYDDDEIWRSLQQVQLNGLIEGLDGGLDAVVIESGGNFSVGQRQLFCLARALLKNNKVLMLDEATANVDLETDAIIQQVIRHQFAHCTVLTIAHRLDTVMDSDKIMVLKAGEILEYDRPHLLLSNPESYLLKLVDQTGPLAAEKLKAMALNASRP